MTPCPCANQPEPCERCKAFRAMHAAPPAKKPKNQHGVIHVTKTDSDGETKTYAIPANRKTRRAHAARGGGMPR